MVRLSEVFPGVRFEYFAEEPPGLAAANAKLSLPLRLWLWAFGTENSYPSRLGSWESGTGGAIEFYFLGGEPVRWIIATSYGRTSGFDAYFDRLYTATGWKVEYPSF